MVEEIARLWVLVGPGLDVGAEGIVKALRAENVFAKHYQSNSGLHVGDHAQVTGIYHVWIVVNSFPIVAGKIVVEITGLVQGRGILSVVEGIGAVVVDEGIESLVHPGVAALVGADDHRERCFRWDRQTGLGLFCR